MIVIRCIDNFKKCTEITFLGGLNKCRWKNVEEYPIVHVYMSCIICIPYLLYEFIAHIPINTHPPLQPNGSNAKKPPINAQDYVWRYP
jgi:hypothetical protein